MKYKLIVCDFDSTAASSAHTVSDYTAKVVRRYIDSGGIFTLSTGRNDRSACKAFDQLKIYEDIPVIVCQGAIVLTSRGKRILRERRIDKDIAGELIADLSDCYIQTYIGNDIYRNRLKSEFAEYYARITGVDPVYTEHIEEIIDEGLHKLIVSHFSDGFRDKLVALRKKYEGRVEFHHTDDRMLEVYSGEAGKGNASAFLAEYYGIPREQVLSFGDSHNDISMIKYAGLGVAVGNAAGEVKAAADYVSETNDDDGVAKTIEKFCFEV